MTETKYIPKSFKTDPEAKRIIRAFRTRVKINLALGGYTLEDLAKKNGLRGNSLSLVFFKPYPRGERIIADALGLQPWDLWPERYENGKPNRPNLWYQRKSGAWKPKTDVVTMS